MNLQKIKSSLTSAVILAALFTTVQFPAAQAATIGSGNCVQTVDAISDVSVVESGNYCYIAFKAGTRVWSTPANVASIDYLVVAGGGSGGARHGGGGGAGGLLKSTSVSISNVTSFEIVVGAGGNSVNTSAYYYAPGLSGSNSILAKKTGSGAFATVTAVGGGGGEAGGTGAQNGGSGGGSQSASRSTPTSGQGNSGGTGGSGTISGATNWWSGGGGGAGSPGSNGSASGGGSGGTGAIWLSDFTTTIATALGLTQTGQTSGSQVYFAGGGGGAITNSYTPGGGGLGGGGAAVTANNTGVSGTANSGGGGGGTGCCDGGPTGAGGSGIILIRYIADSTAPTITGPSSATGAASSASIAENSTAVHTFTANESVTWSKSGTDGSFFTIDSSSGLLTITARDFESPADNGNNNTYVVTITATDGASNVTTQTLTVTITNLNEAPTITTAFSAATHSITQAENISSVVTYGATDVDAGSTLSFSISGTDAADFTINSSSGVLSFAANPDFEAPIDSDSNNTYIVVITVSDGALTDTQTLTVTITNANESASVGAPTLSGAALKGSVLTITVTSNAAGKVRFFVGGKRISNCLARSTTGSYPNFSATCSWKPPVTGSQSLTARITPTDPTFTATTSVSTGVWVVKRNSTR